MDYIFEWDPGKAQQNKKKHGISFDQVTTIFIDPMAISIYDTEHSKDEDRWVTLGLSANYGLIIACHTYQRIDESTARIRIFSSRKATKRESQQYLE